MVVQPFDRYLADHVGPLVLALIGRYGDVGALGASIGDQVGGAVSGRGGGLIEGSREDAEAATWVQA